MIDNAILVDSEHRIIASNQAFRDLCGLDADPCGRRCAPVAHGTDDPPPYCPVDRALQAGAPQRYVALDAATGAHIELTASFTGLQTEDGSPILLHTMRDVSEEWRGEEHGRRKHQSVLVLSELLRVALGPGTMDDQVERILDLVIGIPWLALEEKGAFFDAAPGSGELRLRVARGLAPDLLRACARVPFGHCHCGVAAQTRDAVFAAGLDERHVTQYEGITPHGHYCVPVLLDREVVGVLNLYLSDGHVEDEFEQAFLVGVARVISTVIRRHRDREQA